MTSFEGRGERRVKHILERIFETVAISQAPIKHLISNQQYDQMSEVYQKRKYDLYLPTKKLIVEVNYKHTNKAQQKEGIHAAHLKEEGINLIPIQDWNCPRLFRDSHLPSWDDWIEVIQELKRNGINEKGEKIK